MEKVIYLAGGCFWGVEGYFKRLKGVMDTTVGYANGNIKNPTYTQVKTHIATHAETVKITYDDTIISLTKLLEHFLRIINPYELNHQGEDFGIQYRTGVYYLSHYDEKIIKDYIKEKDIDNNFVVEILPLDNFYDAEDYHQDYLDVNPNGYCHINFNLIRKDEAK